MEQLLEKELKRFLVEYEPYAKKYFEKKVKNTKKYSPIISQFYKNLADFGEGGKKMRAFLVWLGYRIGSSRQARTINTILPIALAFEMTQSFFLIHDDIIDRSDLRRGKPTMHRVFSQKHGEPASPAGRHYGESMAIMLGDIACVELFDLVNSSSFDDKSKVVCQELLARVLLETAYGQTLDIHYAYSRASLADIWKVVDLKTARYSFVGPLVVGAILAGASKKQIDALSSLGLFCGTAFQLQDDILGVFGDEKVLGKPNTSDMREGKNTVLIYKTREMASNIERQKLAKLWGRDSATVSDLEKIREIIKRSGALDWCRRENQRLVARAKSYIRGVTSDRDLKLIFSQIADFVVSREK